MDRLDAMRLFVRIVERRSFTQAALDLGVPRSTATQVIKQMEAGLGTRLLQRTTRHVGPTLDGEDYHRRCLAILAEVEAADTAFSGAKPRGLLRVDVHGTLARHFVLPALPEFLAAYPEIEIHLGEGDRLVDLVREGVDCVLRVGEPPATGEMVARRVAMLDEATVASPAYLARHGTPASPDDLAGHRAVGFVSSRTGSALPFEFVVRGAVREIVLPSTVSVTAAESLIAAGRLGLGLVQAPRYHLAPDIAAGALVPVLEAFAPTPTPVSLLYARGRLLSPRVRVFIEWVSRRFAAERGGG